MEEETYEPSGKRQRIEKQDDNETYYQSSSHEMEGEVNQPQHYSPERSTAQILSQIGSDPSQVKQETEPAADSSPSGGMSQLTTSQDPELSSSLTASQIRSIHSLTNSSSPTSGGPASPSNPNNEINQGDGSNNSSSYYHQLVPNTSTTLPVPQFPPNSSSSASSSSSAAEAYPSSHLPLSYSGGFYNSFMSPHEGQSQDGQQIAHPSLHFFTQQQHQQQQHFQNQQMFQQHQQPQQQLQQHHPMTAENLSSQIDSYNSNSLIPLSLGESPTRTKTVSKKKRDLSKEVQEKMDKLFEEAKKHKKRKALYSHLTIEPTPEAITVDGETKYRCTLCKKIYGRKDSCRKHISSELWEYPCSFCGIISATAQACMYHVMAKHLHMQVFDCPFCDKRFATHYALSNHQERTHSSSSGSAPAAATSSSGALVSTTVPTITGPTASALVSNTSPGVNSVNPQNNVTLPLDPSTSLPSISAPPLHSTSMANPSSLSQPATNSSIPLLASTQSTTN